MALIQVSEILSFSQIYIISRWFYYWNLHFVVDLFQLAMFDCRRVALGIPVSWIGSMEESIGIRGQITHGSWRNSNGKSYCCCNMSLYE